jgi:flagellar hook-associated protein 1
MGLGSVLSIANTALRTQTEGITVISQNIANASTEGYSRQRLVIAANKPLVTPDGVFGNGVSSADVVQIRDQFVDAQYRRASGLQAQADARQETLSRVEVLINEPSETGVASQLDRFYSSFSELASNPSSSLTRTMVLSEATELVARLNSLSGELDIIRTDTESVANNSLARVNDLLSRVGDLNREVVSAESGGRTAGDLRDSRNMVIDELATLVPIQVIEKDSGSVGVLSEGVLLIDGARSNSLDIVDNAGTLELRIVGRATVINSSRGTLGARLELLNTDLPGLVSDLDSLVSDIVTSVNAVHSTGISPDGSTNLNFFSATGLTASSFAIDAAMTGPDRVVAGVASGTGAYQAGENSLALQIAQLRDTNGGLGATTGAFYRDLVSAVGRKVSTSRDEAQVQGTLSGAALSQRLSVSGVAIDEELVEMIQLQTAYGAAARIITTVDEMMATLVRI